MPFVKRYQEIVKRALPYSPARLWLNTVVFSLLIFLALSLYLFLRRGEFNLYIANKVFASTAMILIGLSFALSGLCFFWDFVDTKIIYRKHLGLSGFSFAVVHVLVSLFFLPERFALSAYFSSHLTAFVFGLLALLIFTMMAAISNQYAFHELGSKRWRLLLRSGYIAYVLVIFHFGILKYKSWVSWLTTFKPLLPPLSLLLVIFSLAVIILRLALFLATSSVLTRRRKNCKVGPI